MDKSKTNQKEPPQSVTSCDRLHVRAVHGYIAIRSKHPSSTAGWLYLRKHSATELFIGNIPQPKWFSTSQLGLKVTAEHLQQRMKTVIKYMVPGAEEIGDVFGTGNGRVATRIKMKEGESGVEELLKQPGEHLDVNWDRLWAGSGEGEEIKEEGVMERWLREYAEQRDEREVERWSQAAMKAYEAREQRRKEEEKRMERKGGVVDHDGFELVTKGARQMKAAEAVKVGTGGRVKKGTYKSKSGRNRKSLLDMGKGIEKDGFYRWQREGKNRVQELQTRFKEDQKRIRAIQALGEGKGKGS